MVRVWALVLRTLTDVGQALASSSGWFLTIVVVAITHCAEFGSARLWCFLGGQKAAMNLLPILTRWPTKLDLLLLYLLTSKAVMGGIFWGFWYVMVCELDDESYQTVWRDWRGSEERQPAFHLCWQVRFVFVFNLYLYLTIWQFALLRYARLHRLWLNHGIAEKVTHNTEASPGAEII